MTDLNHPHFYHGNDMDKALAADQAKLDAMLETSEPPKPIDPINAARDEMNMTKEERALVSELLLFSIRLQLKSMTCRTREETERMVDAHVVKAEREFLTKLRAYKYGPVLNEQAPALN